MQKPECIICYKKINKKINMNLTCECKYDIHKSCFMRWFKLKEECIICHKKAYAPNRQGAQLLKDEWLRNKIEKNKYLSKCPTIQWYDLFVVLRISISTFLLLKIIDCLSKIINNSTDRN
tara:strand:+ start:2096 stop:2455 length:360 start_codon:yes stop_codon:yes gene_type:complete